jgi:hypothetical protein
MIKMNYNFNTQITFENGLTISIAIGEGNYCSNRQTEEDINPYNTYAKERTSNNCEVMVWNKNNQDVPIKQFLPEGQSNDGLCAGWVSPNSLAVIISNVASWHE